jgi:hypothetical protein
MSELLKSAVEAHGRPAALKAIENGEGETLDHRCNLLFEGLKEVSIEAELPRERLTMRFNGQHKRTVFEPNRVSLETENGQVLDTRDDPRASFRGHSQETPWDDLYVAYFSGYALWNYLSIPFSAHLSEMCGGRNCAVGRRRRAPFPIRARATVASRWWTSVRMACCAHTSTPWTFWVAPLD